jgi:hypothetical protein
MTSRPGRPRGDKPVFGLLAARGCAYAIEVGYWSRLLLLVTRAGRLTRIGGHRVLRVAHNPGTEAVYASIDERLAA